MGGGVGEEARSGAGMLRNLSRPFVQLNAYGALGGTALHSHLLERRQPRGLQESHAIGVALHLRKIERDMGLAVVANIGRCTALKQ